jgi:hypothetical protein
MIHRQALERKVLRGPKSHGKGQAARNFQKHMQALQRVQIFGVVVKGGSFHFQSPPHDKFQCRGDVPPISTAQLTPDSAS